VNSRHGNVRGITNGMRRKYASCHDGLGQRFGVLRDFESRQAANDCESLLNLRWITRRGFVDDDLGDAILKLAPSIRPPLLRRLLVRSDKQVTTGTSDQVADERCFQVHRFHADPSRGRQKLPQLVRPHGRYRSSPGTGGTAGTLANTRPNAARSPRAARFSRGTAAQ
jgi:hypothetical protein